MTAVLRVDHLGIIFRTRQGPLQAVKDATFEIHPGEVFGLVGESGAGKSLTGQAIIGLLDPPGMMVEGAIYLKDQRIDQLPLPQMRKIQGNRIGMIFQDPLTSLNPLYTVGRQLVETIRTHTDMGGRQARDTAIHWLKAVGIPSPESRMEQYPHQFSGGMRQRVVIALVLCTHPDLIIADEPTTALDVSIQAQIIHLLKRLSLEQGSAVLLITHDMGVIAEIADRVAVMYSGRIVEQGPVKTIIENAQHPYTQGLMAAIPRLNKTQNFLTQIEGNMPKLSERPSGCAFHPRCQQVMDQCKQAIPTMMETPQTQVACWLFGEV